MVVENRSEIYSQEISFKIAQTADPVAKNIQDRIANTQKQLQALSANAEMDPQEKMKKRQELLQQINDLNNQLKQREIEQRKQIQEKKQQKENVDASDNLQNVAQTNDSKQDTGFSATGMHAMISADSSIKRAQIQERVVIKFEGSANVLETEIKLDEARATNGRTANVSWKRKSIADARKKSADINALPTDILKNASIIMKKAREKEKEKKSEKADEKSGANRR